MLENTDSHSPTHLIKKEELTVERLFEIFQAAYMKPEIDDDKDLMVSGRTGITHFVQVREWQGIINMFSIFGFTENLDTDKKLEAVNKLNYGKVMVRFSVNGRGDLFADYHLLTEEGVTPFQILNCFTWFDRVIAGSIDDVKDLLG